MPADRSPLLLVGGANRGNRGFGDGRRVHILAQTATRDASAACRNHPRLGLQPGLDPLRFPACLLSCKCGSIYWTSATSPARTMDQVMV